MHEAHSSPDPKAAEVVVVGAGLAGLACAGFLHGRDVDVQVLEAADEVGGRVRTDRLRGFLLDRGFQIILTAYEEIRALDGKERLELQAFKPGSLVWNGSKLDLLADPVRSPRDLIASAAASVGSLGDKLKVARLRQRLVSASAASCFSGPDRSTEAELRSLEFSEGFINQFFRPFLGGVFLERGLTTSSHLFNYYFRCFARGDATLPSQGMQRLPELLAEPLRDRIALNAPVRAVSGSSVTLYDGRTVRAKRVVLAADGVETGRLLDRRAPEFKATVTAYYAAPEPPVDTPMLVLDGEGIGPANHVAVVSNVAPDYAPKGAHLVAVSGVGGAAADEDRFRRRVPAQLERWFGEGVQRWEHLRTYRIPHALPAHPPGSLDLDAFDQPSADGVVVAGDHVSFGSIQGALRSGRLAGKRVLSELS